MNRYPTPEIKDLPKDIVDKILEVQEKAGFVPQVFLSLARRPAEWRAFFAYHDALMLKEDSNLTKGDREMIVTTTSAANHCLYCVVAHGAILRIYEKKPLVADQVAINYRKADISARQRAITRTRSNCVVPLTDITFRKWKQQLCAVSKNGKQYLQMMH